MVQSHHYNVLFNHDSHSYAQESTISCQLHRPTASEIYYLAFLNLQERSQPLALHSIGIQFMGLDQRSSWAEDSDDQSVSQMCDDSVDELYVFSYLFEGHFSKNLADTMARSDEHDVWVKHSWTSYSLKQYLAVDESHERIFIWR
jgi:hypothetical protein